jgi:hypothetical protein
VTYGRADVGRGAESGACVTYAEHADRLDATLKYYVTYYGAWKEADAEEERQSK